ncbi:MAG: bifunctional phosphoglucose/phosphomannose isomerase [Anaerolineales bacterium]|nr:bifunctional phosphoglucose/phosphomannose isomerase [Anaerolineales bacterium]
MNLDNFSAFPQLDTRNMLAEIDNLPDQLQKAWELGQTQPLPSWKGIRQVVLAGMGGSAIGADLLAAYVAPNCPIPVFVHRDYTLPAWASGQETLVVAASHSGNTEETLAAFGYANAGGCRTLALCTGGELAAQAEKIGAPIWHFEHKHMPRAAVGFQFGLLLALFTRLGLIPDPSATFDGAISAMRTQQEMLRAAVPVAKNPAKRLAGQLIGRWVTVFGAEFLTPVARRWKGQVSELAKAWGQFEFLPEADHNTLAGTINPEEVLGRMVAIFLRASSYHARNRVRSELTRKMFMLEGINTDFFDARGDTPLAQQWTALHFGDYMAFYLAMAYESDPTPIEALEHFKSEMKNTKA